jgi:hypothetical protein
MGTLKDGDRDLMRQRFMNALHTFCGCPLGVESRLGASTDAGAPPRFPAPLIKPDMPVSSIRLSD